MWNYLEPRADETTNQLFVVGTRVRASTVWGTMIANGLTPEQAAQSRGLPLEAVQECIAYSEANTELLLSDENRDRVAISGIPVDVPRLSFSSMRMRWTRSSSSFSKRTVTTW